MPDSSSPGSLDALRAALTAEEIRRVLVVRVARLGDTLHVLPALSLLREALPQAELVFLCSLAGEPLARGAPVDAVVGYPHKGRTPGAVLARRRVVADLRARGPFDLFLGLEDKPWGRRLARALGCRFHHATSEGGTHVVERKAGVLRPLGLWGTARPPWISWPVPDDSAVRAKARVQDLPRPLIGLQVGSHASARRVRRRRDPSLTWLEALGAHLLNKLGGTLVIQGGRSRGEGAQARQVASGLCQRGLSVALLEHLNVVELGGVLAQLDAYVSANTGPAHLAAAVGTPLVLLEGPSTPHARPWCPGGRLRVIRAGLPCSPCKGRPHGKFCQVPRCLDELSVEAVAEATRQLAPMSGSPTDRGPGSNP